MGWREVKQVFGDPTTSRDAAWRTIVPAVAVSALFGFQLWQEESRWTYIVAWSLVATTLFVAVRANAVATAIVRPRASFPTRWRLATWAMLVASWCLIYFVLLRWRGHCAVLTVALWPFTGPA